MTYVTRVLAERRALEVPRNRVAQVRGREVAGAEINNDNQISYHTPARANIHARPWDS